MFFSTSHWSQALRGHPQFHSSYWTTWHQSTLISTHLHTNFHHDALLTWSQIYVYMQPTPYPYKQIRHTDIPARRLCREYLHQSTLCLHVYTRPLAGPLVCCKHKFWTRLGDTFLPLYLRLLITIPASEAQLPGFNAARRKFIRSGLAKRLTTGIIFLLLVTRTNQSESRRNPTTNQEQKAMILL